MLYILILNNIPVWLEYLRETEFKTITGRNLLELIKRIQSKIIQ